MPEITTISFSIYAVRLPGPSIERVELLVDLNNQFYHGPRLAIAMGAATCEQGGRIEQTMSQADARMYAAKKEYYATAMHDRRR